MTGVFFIFSRRLEVSGHVIGQQVAICADSHEEAQRILSSHLRDVADDEPRPPWSMTGDRMQTFDCTSIPLDRSQVLMSQSSFLEEVLHSDR